MRNVVALILAGGRLGHYGVLTHHRPKASLPFFANYRIIDFTLTSLRRAGIEQAGLIIQYLPTSLIDHVQGGRPWDWNFLDRRLKIMPPFVGRESTEWYHGTADALHRNWDFVAECNPEHVIVCSGEHVYSLDYASLVRSHMEQDADVTLVTRLLGDAECKPGFGYVVRGSGGRVKEFHEKPERRPSHEASTAIYVFKTRVLEELLSACRSPECTNLARDILQPHVGSLQAYSVVMPGEWHYLENLQEYYDLQMALLREPGLATLRGYDLITNLESRNMGNAPPAFVPAGGAAVQSALGPRCRIAGTVRNSILSAGTVVEAGAEVHDSILMHDVRVGAGARLHGVICDQDAVFESGARAGDGDEAGGGGGGHAGSRLVLVGKRARIRSAAVLPAGAEIQSGATHP